MRKWIIIITILLVNFDIIFAYTGGSSDWFYNDEYFDYEYENTGLYEEPTCRGQRCGGDTEIQTVDVYHNKPISNTNSDSVINEQNLGDDPLRQSLRDVGSNIEGIAYQDIENSDQAQKYTMDYIKKIFDYFIALLALIVLVYMLYNFFIMLTASGQDEKYKKGVEGIKTAFLVIIGIGISWLVVSFIFYLVKIFTTG